VAGESRTFWAISLPVRPRRPVPKPFRTLPRVPGKVFYSFESEASNEWMLCRSVNLSSHLNGKN